MWFETGFNIAGVRGRPSPCRPNVGDAATPSRGPTPARPAPFTATNEMPPHSSAHTTPSGVFANRNDSDIDELELDECATSELPLSFRPHDAVKDSALAPPPGTAPFDKPRNQSASKRLRFTVPVASGSPQAAAPRPPQDRHPAAASGGRLAVPWPQAAKPWLASGLVGGMCTAPLLEAPPGRHALVTLCLRLSLCICMCFSSFWGAQHFAQAYMFVGSVL